MANVPQTGSSSDGTTFSDPLAGVPDEARTLLWQGFLRAVDGDLGLGADPARHAAHPAAACAGAFRRALQRRRLTPAAHGAYAPGLAHMLHELPADLLEAVILGGSSAEYAPQFAACCTRIGQIYSEIKRRGGLLFALLVLRWELKLLGYRGSAVLAPLLFEEVGR